LRWRGDVIQERISMKKLRTYEDHIASEALSRRLAFLKEYLRVEA
jgi:hypothetical protein